MCRGSRIAHSFGDRVLLPCALNVGCQVPAHPSCGWTVCEIRLPRCSGRLCVLLLLHVPSASCQKLTDETHDV